MGYYATTLNMIATTAVNIASFVKQDPANPNAVVQAGVGDTAIGITGPATNYPPGVPGATTVAAAAGTSVVIYPVGSVVEVQVGATTVTPGPVKPDVNGYATIAYPGELATATAFVTGITGSFVRCKVLETGVRVASASAGGELTVTVSTVLTGANGGSTIFANGSDLTITLPAASTSPGMEIRVVTKSVAGSTGTLIATTGTDAVIGRAGTVTLPGTASKGALNTDATAVVGDSMTLKSDGVSLWYIIASTGIWAQQA